MTTSNPILSQLVNTLALSPLNIYPICFKNSKNPSCIDLLFINLKPSFIKTNSFKTSISDHNKMISTLMKFISQEIVLKQNTTETTVNLIPISLVLNSLAN